MITRVFMVRCQCDYKQANTYSALTYTNIQIRMIYILWVGAYYPHTFVCECVMDIQNLLTHVHQNSAIGPHFFFVREAWNSSAQHWGKIQKLSRLCMGLSLRRPCLVILCTFVVTAQHSGDWMSTAEYALPQPACCSNALATNPGFEKDSGLRETSS